MQKLIRDILNQSRIVPRGERKGQMEIYLQPYQQEELLKAAQELGVRLPLWLEPLNKTSDRRKTED